MTAEPRLQSELLAGDGRSIRREQERHARVEGIGKIRVPESGMENYDAALRGGMIARMRIYSALRFQAPVPSLPVITASASWIS